MYAAFLACLLAADRPGIDRVDPDKTTGSSAAVVLDESPLVHTTQLFPAGKERGDLAKQLSALLDRLAKDLESTKSDLDRVVKLNIHLARPSDVAAAHKVLARRFDGKHKPAVLIDVGTPAQPGVLVSLDAVAVAGVTPQPGKVDRKGADLAVLPAGPVYYVSGQAESGLDLSRATRRTLESLRATLEHLGRDDSHVVQIKAFLSPMSKVADVRKEIEGFYGKGKVPPTVLVEWTARGSIEIELIAAAPPAKEKAKGAIDYITPAKMTSSPVFSRVARVNHGRRIYTSGIAGTGKDGAAMVKDFFDRLEGVLKKSGGDLKHLAKATYLVSDEEASKQLNAHRLRVYDPKRPPAASKSPVTATGKKDCGLMVDMIAVVSR